MIDFMPQIAGPATRRGRKLPTPTLLQLHGHQPPAPPLPLPPQPHAPHHPPGPKPTPGQGAQEFGSVVSSSPVKKLDKGSASLGPAVASFPAAAPGCPLGLIPAIWFPNTFLPFLGAAAGCTTR